MSAEKRREKILELMQNQGEVQLSQLVSIFPEVSQMTLRRDLDYFQSLEIAFRTHGGARLSGSDRQEPRYDLRKSKNAAAKTAIGKLALPLVVNGSSVYFDSGTTIMAFARILKTHTLSITTSDPNIALELAPVSNSNFTLLGGQLNRNNLTLAGGVALKNLDDMSFDTAFLAASAFTSDGVFTCGSYAENEVKKKVLQKSKVVVMLCDISKEGTEMDFSFASLEDVDIFICDAPPSQAFIEAAKKSKTKIIY